MDYDDRWQRMQDRMARQQERFARRQERWDRRQERRANRQHYRGTHSAAHGIVVSVAVIAIGALFLLDNLGIVRFRDVWRFWPVVLIALGTVRLVDSHGTASVVWGAMLAGIGGLLPLDNLNIIFFDWRLFWPGALIAVGILMLLRTTQWSHHGPAGPSGAPPPPGTLNLFTMFQGGEHRVDAQDFRGGQISAMFGGFEIDLRGAKMADAQSTIDVSLMFGGAEIQIPDTWIADVRGMGLFGAFVNETRPPRPEANVTPPRLIITGYAMFGGVTVTN